MRRIAYAFSFAFVLVLFGGVIGTASAGDYRGYDGYYVHRYHGDRYHGARYYSDTYHHRPRYSGSHSSCCYKKVTRYEKIYPRTSYYDDYDYPRRSYYHDDPYHRSYRYTRRYYDRPHYYSRPYYSGPRVVYSERAHLLRFNRGYNYAGYGCSSRDRIRIPDGRGGWVWGYPTGC